LGFDAKTIVVSSCLTIIGEDADFSGADVRRFAPTSDDESPQLR